MDRADHLHVNLANCNNRATVHTGPDSSYDLGRYIAAGLRLDRLDEFDTLDWKALDHMVETPSGQRRLPDHQHDYVPLMFAVDATRMP